MYAWNNVDGQHSCCRFLQSKNFVLAPKGCPIDLKHENGDIGKAVLRTKSFKLLYTLWNVVITKTEYLTR